MTTMHPKPNIQFFAQFLSENHTLLRLTKQILDQADRKFAQWQNRLPPNEKMSCQKGCGLCCDMLNWVTLAEAATLYPHLSKAQIDLFHHKEKKLFCLTRNNPNKDVFELYRLQVGFCPLLNRQYLCSLYSWRPLSCRSAFSFFPPFLCRSDLMKRYGYIKMNTIIERRPSALYHDSPYAIDPLIYREKYTLRLNTIMKKTIGIKIEGTLLSLICFLSLTHGMQSTSSISIKTDIFSSWIKSRQDNNLIKISPRSVL